MEVTNLEFWQAVDYSLFVELAGLFMGCYVVGYGFGYKFYLFRRFAHSSVG